MTEIIFILACLAVLAGLKWMSAVQSAKKGILAITGGICLAALITLFQEGLSMGWILLGVVIGAAIGYRVSSVSGALALPAKSAFLSGCAALASVFAAWACYHSLQDPDRLSALCLFLAISLGGAGFGASVVVAGRMGGWINDESGIPETVISARKYIFLALVVCGLWIFVWPVSLVSYIVFVLAVVAAALLGLTMASVAGDAETPFVVSMLPCAAGLAACACGLALRNHAIIVTGALAGAGGLVLSAAMRKACDASILGLALGSAGRVEPGAGKAEDAACAAQPINPLEAAALLKVAGTVVIIPGSVEALSAAGDAVGRLGEAVKAGGCRVRYAVHPASGRMPGQIQAMLAASGVPEEDLADIEDINSEMTAIDVCVVLGAGAVVDPAAREDKDSPIYGMPIVHAYFSRAVIVFERPPGPESRVFTNALFSREKTCAVLGDVRTNLEAVLSAFHPRKQAQEGGEEKKQD